MPNLLICHASTAEVAIAVLSGGDPGTLEVLAYGRGASQLPIGSQAKLLSLPPLDQARLTAARRLVRFVREVRAKKYQKAVVAHPGLRESWFRGPLLVFGHVAGARSVFALREDGELEPIPLARALLDATTWAVILGLSQLLALTAALVVSRVSPAARRGKLPSTGTVVYLRTDVELAGKTLEAGGSVAHTAGIVNALGRREYHVEFWSTGEITGVDSNEAVRLPVVVRANLPQEIGELMSSFLQILSTRGRRPAPAPAFVYQRYSLNNLTGLLLTRLWRVPLVLEVNASEVLWRERWSALRFPRLARACEKAILCGAERVVTVSDNASCELVEQGASPQQLKTVPNGVDVERFAEARPRNLPMPPGSFVIAFVGLFYPWHGVHILAEAFKLLCSRYDDARLLLIGDGEEVARTRAILTRGGVINCCLLTGTVPRADVPGYLAAADVLVAPHTNVHNFIGSPVKIFEYMAAGRAIVVSRVGQMAEVLRNRETALIVPPDDPQALADALSELRDDAHLRRRLASAAQEEARVSHSWDARLSAILEHTGTPTVLPRRSYRVASPRQPK